MIFWGESGKDGEDRFPRFALQYINYNNGLNPKYINNKKWANIISIRQVKCIYQNGLDIEK